MSNKVRLNVLGISYSQTQTGAYALVLAEEGGKRRIPIIVGGFEAQAIAIQLEGLKPPRPLTHDLIVNFAKTFNIDLLEVTIYKLEEGIFFSKLTCDDGKRIVEVDARTSDAIALALRFKCPIYTTEDILQRAGIVIDFEQEDEMEDETGIPYKKNVDIGNNEHEGDLKQFSLDELELMLEDAVKDENYEKASLLRDEIKRRKEKNKKDNL